MPPMPPTGDDPFALPREQRVVREMDLEPYLHPDAPAGPDTALVHIAPGTPPLLALRDLVTHEGFPELFARALRATAPELREYFPLDPRPVLGRLARALEYAFVTTEEAAGDSERVEQVVDFARHLGADHRKLAIPPAHVERFGEVLATTCAHLAGPAWDETLAGTLQTAYSVLTQAMRAGAEAGHGPARVGATVHSVDRPVPGIAVVRLVTDEMIDYLPGQHLSVLTPYAPAVWRPLSPANPTNPMGQVEFLVRDVPGGVFSGALVRGAVPGDRWVLARPLGHLEVDRTEPARDVLMIAGGTGVAPMRSLLVDMMRYGDNPRVHLFYGAAHPGELHDLPTLVELASSAPWLTVQPVAEHTEDPWWMGERPEPPRALHRTRTGRLVDVVTGYGSWADRQVLVAGSPEMIRATVRGLVAAGTPRESIAFDPY